MKFKYSPVTKKIFNKKSVACKRILIAEDVLQQLKLKNYIAESGVYISVPNAGVYSDQYESPLVEVLKTEQCHVCAVGACVASIAKIEGTITEENMDNNNGNLVTALKGVFTPKQLQQMESAFEGGNCGFAQSYMGAKALSDDNSKFCEDFADKYPDDTIRLTKIMKNIIKNEGKFVLRDLK